LPVLTRQNAIFVSLQYGNCSEEIAVMKRDHGIQVHHWQQPIDDYDETAALVSALDLVISVQTAVIHLAGALGKRTWVMVPVTPEWRYLGAGATMPWYSAVTLYRQPAPDDWRELMARVAARLTRELRDGFLSAEREVRARPC
jgi:ADP-heptose:LPS heptosyltransferase